MYLPRPLSIWKRSFLFEIPGNRKLLQPNSSCSPLCKSEWVPICLTGPSQHAMRMFFVCTTPNVCFLIFLTRNTPLTSPYARPGMTNASVTMAALRVLFWMVTWCASYGSRIPFFGILRRSTIMGSPDSTTWFASTKMARCCTQIGTSNLLGLFFLFWEFLLKKHGQRFHCE